MYKEKNQNMKYWFVVFLMSISTSSFGEESKKSSLWSDIQGSLSQTWQSKNYELFIPVNTWHNRSFYSTEKIASYNEEPWGLGMSKYRVDEAGNRHSLFRNGLFRFSQQGRAYIWLWVSKNMEGSE